MPRFYQALHDFFIDIAQVDPAAEILDGLEFPPVVTLSHYRFQRIGPTFFIEARPNLMPAVLPLPFDYKVGVAVVDIRFEHSILMRRHSATAVMILSVLS